jgi:hypothetical protein
MNQIEKLRAILSHMIKHHNSKEGHPIWVLKDNSPDWMQEVIQKAHGDKGPDDLTYEYIVEALRVFDENYREPVPDKLVMDLEDCLMQLDPDIYTNKLTGWLHRRVDNIYYLNQAIEQYNEMGHTEYSGTDLLQCAQMIHKLEVANALIVASRNDPPSPPPTDGPDPEPPKDPNKPSVTIPGKDDFVMDDAIDEHRSREEEGKDGWDIRYQINMLKISIKSDNKWAEWHLTHGNESFRKEGENSYWGKECFRNAQSEINNVVESKKQITAFRELLRRVLDEGHQAQHCGHCSRVILDDDDPEECAKCAQARQEYEWEINA